LDITSLRGRNSVPCLPRTQFELGVVVILSYPFWKQMFDCPKGFFGNRRENLEGLDGRRNVVDKVDQKRDSDEPQEQRE
jgi:hypothetical protein